MIEIDLQKLLGGTLRNINLEVKKAIALKAAIDADPFTHFTESLRREDHSETIKFTTEVERGEIVINDIDYREEIAVVFDASDDKAPEIYALRKDFPRLIHTNILPFTYPVSLCLYDELYEEQKLKWRAPQFLQDIRRWLALNAAGKLHQPDQPVEPFLNLFNGYLLLSENLDGVVALTSIRETENFLYVAPVPSRGEPTKDFAFLNIEVEIRNHQGIRHLPLNLEGLLELVEGLGVDLKDSVRRLILDHNESEIPRNSKLIIHLKTIIGSINTPDCKVESYAFLILEGIAAIGEALGLGQMQNGEFGIFIGQAPGNLSHIRVHTLKIVRPFNIPMAHATNGLDAEAGTLQGVLIGSGALGSQLFMNLARMGLGRWTIIDHDSIMPHNLGRHAAFGNMLFQSKSATIAGLANGILLDSNFASGIEADFLRSKDEKIQLAISDADVVLDISTSVAVAKKLALDIDSKSRRFSIFLNPTGTDLIILGEDSERSCPLDILEAQYYFFISQEDKFPDHLKFPSGVVRYSNGCRDVSFKLSQAKVAMFSGLATDYLLKALNEPEAKIMIWHFSDEDNSISSAKALVSKTSSKSFGGWRVEITENLLKKMSLAREQKLPNETGGVLIGQYDFQRQIIYAVDTMLSPPDSEEYPTAYIRGIKGLKEKLEVLSKRTAGNLQYIGEWHSHPKGASLKPSGDDKILFQWLTSHMEALGLPPLMVIMGDNPTFNLVME